jgi:hypothetical protein
MNTQISLDTILLASPALATLDARLAPIFGHNTDETAVLAHVALSHVHGRAPRSETIEVPLSLIEGSEDLQIADSFSVLMDIPSEGLKVRLFLVVEEIWEGVVFVRVCRREDLKEIFREIALAGVDAVSLSEEDWSFVKSEKERLQNLATAVPFMDLDPTAREEGADLQTETEALSFETEAVKVVPTATVSRRIIGFDLQLLVPFEDLRDLLIDLDETEGLRVRGVAGKRSLRIELKGRGEKSALQILKETFGG